MTEGGITDMSAGIAEEQGRRGRERRPAAVPRLDEETYRAKLVACWRGKAVGGTLGQSFEGLEGPIDVDYYFPVPDGMVPNDDLDVQVAYAARLLELEPARMDRHVIAEVWRDNLRFPWNEYGVGKRNLAEGIAPPHSGAFDNWFSCGEGAVIRSELWACLAPGEPSRAAAYAAEDACFDHAGDGVWAAVFMAALQSLAFVESDPDVLLDRAVGLLPVESRIRQVVHDTRVWVAQGRAWQEVRELVVARYGADDFTDVRMNTGFVILGWLASGGDFERAILITNGCGADTDSTTASLGALLAILDPGAIPERWLAPIGDELVLNAEVVGIAAPADVPAFAEQILELRERLDGVWPEAEEEGFDPDAFAIPVTVGWATPYGVPWGLRDATGLSPAGAPEPALPEDAAPQSLPGTWVRWPAADFRDRILVLEYRVRFESELRGKLMFSSTEHFRVWLDGEYVLGGQPGPIFPAQHRPLAGHGADIRLAPGEHRIRATILRPAAGREVAEWVVGIAQEPHYEWLPGAFRPSPPAA